MILFEKIVKKYGGVKVFILMWVLAAALAVGMTWLTDDHRSGDVSFAELIKDSLLPVALIAVGLFLLLFPDLAWALRHYFTVRSGEPTDFFLVTTQIAGTLADAAAISCAGTVLSQPPTSTTASMG